MNPRPKWGEYVVVMVLILSLLSAGEFGLIWTDGGGVFSVQFDSRSWLYTESKDSFSLTHQSLEGLEIKITDRSTDPADPPLSDIAKQTVNHGGERQAAAVIQESNLEGKDLALLNAAEGYYCEGVYGPDLNPISVRVLVLRKSGKLLIAEGNWPGTKDQNEYSWRKCKDALDVVWKTITAVGKTKK